MTGSSRCLGRALAECPAEYFPDEQSVKSIRNSKMNNSMKAMQVVRGICQSLCIVLLLLSCGALSAQNQEHRVRNIVLVHGAWADGSGWKGVYDILVKDGYNVSIVQEPETSFKEDVAATKRTLLSRRKVHSRRSQRWGMNQITHLCGYATAHAGCAASGFASHSGAIAMTLLPVLIS